MYCIYPAILNRKRLLDDDKSIWNNFVYVFENIIPRCGRSLHLYALFITDQYQKKYWAGYIGR
jgi:hypothetical protein